MPNIKKKNNLLQSIVKLIDNTRKKVAVAVNSELTLLYWHIGKKINDDILQNKRADYGKNIIVELSKELTKIYGKGFSKQNLHNFIKFHELFSNLEIVHSLSRQLTWTHIRNLIYIEV
jgi:hypothetical protein